MFFIFKIINKFLGEEKFVKTKFQKLVVSLLVAIMFLTSNGTLALAVEINEIVDANSVATVEDVVEENVAIEDLTQVVT